METKIRFRCYHCHRSHTVDSSASGRRGRCLCGTLMIVPDVPPEETSWPEPGPQDGGTETLPMAHPPPEDSTYPARGVRRAGEDSDADPIPDLDEILRGLPGPIPLEPLTSRSGPEGREAARTRPNVGASGSRWSLTVGIAEILLSIPVIAATALVAFGERLRESGTIAEWADLVSARPLGLPAELWSTLGLSLFAVLFLDGSGRILRWRAHEGRTVG